jgi:hypothetical protein
MRRPIVIYDFATDPFWTLIYEENFVLYFIQCVVFFSYSWFMLFSDPIIPEEIVNGDSAKALIF